MGRMPRQRVWAAATLVAGLTFGPHLSIAGPEAGTHEAPAGVWRGTSTCTDRVAAPACHDEVVVYEFTPGAKPGTVRWKADKVVDGQRQPMGEMDLAYDANADCWQGEFQSPRARSVWCLAVDGAHITGSAWLLPGKQTIRKVDVRKEGNQ
jgi:hypothetical protein